jgi:hypothetical protein
MKCARRLLPVTLKPLRLPFDRLYVIGLPSDEQDARACGFPSIGAQMRAIAIAISLLPANSEIRMVERVRGAIPAPVLEKEKMIPTEADSQVLNSMQFISGKYYTAGNVNRRKYERLEEIGWVKGIATNISDVEYYLTETGRARSKPSKYKFLAPFWRSWSRFTEAAWTASRLEAVA